MQRYLYLLRHAESKEKQVGQDDHERKLTPRGMREAALIGTYLYKEKTTIDIIISSTAERAKATAGAHGSNCEFRGGEAKFGEHDYGTDVQDQRQIPRAEDCETSVEFVQHDDRAAVIAFARISYCRVRSGQS